MVSNLETPLAKKLGIQKNMRICLLQEPTDYQQLLDLPSDVDPHRSVDDIFDFIQFFTISAVELAQMFPALKNHLEKNGMLWISWPKQSSKMGTDIDEAVIRRIGLSHGLVDVKVCAVDGTWSGLKFVYRVEDR